MPYCTVCGTQNPDEARFCAQCGNRLVTPGAAEESPTGSHPAAAGSEESTATISISGSADKVESSDRQLNAVDAAAVDALPSGHALLVVQRGPGSGSRFLLDAESVTAGRHPDSDIFLDDVTVSRRHATFERAGATFTVTDAGSLNGTYLNRERIDEGELSNGDEVQIGKFRLVFFSGRTDG